MTVFRSGVSRGLLRSPRREEGVNPVYFNFGEFGASPDWDNMVATAVADDVVLLFPVSRVGYAIPGHGGMVFTNGVLDSANIMKLGFGIYLEDGTRVIALGGNVGGFDTPFANREVLLFATDGFVSWPVAGGIIAQPVFFGFTVQTPSTTPVPGQALMIVTGSYVAGTLPTTDLSLRDF